MKSTVLPKRERYEVKTISYDERGPGWYDIMMVKFVGGGNRALEDAGYGGEHIIYMSIKGGVRHATSDLREFQRELTARDDNHLKDLLVSIENGDSWDHIEDGETFTPREIDEFLGR